MNLDFKSLYIQDQKGAIREWRIGVEDGVIIIEHGQLNGVMQQQTEVVENGKAGRTLEEQIMSRVASRINKQLDRGYSVNIEDAQNKPLNLLGLKKPMLAQKIEDIKLTKDPFWLQPKLDGNRMLIANRNGDIIAYSRNGKEIKTLDHIVDNISIPVNTIIDGEIYCHGERLQTIVSWAKRKQDNTRKLRYHAYDIINNDSFVERFTKLSEFNLGESVDIVETIRINDSDSLYYKFNKYILEGYEGAIIRLDGFGYEDGKRSKSLIKMKKWFDYEFLVINIKESADGWAILTCIISNKTFTVSAPGTMSEKIHVLNNMEDYIGKKVTVKYSQITKDGIPFHPVATGWRDTTD